MQFFKQKNPLTLIFLLNVYLVLAMPQVQAEPASGLNAPPVVNSSVKKPAGISNNETPSARELRNQIKETELDYSKYMSVLKQHRDKVADLKVVRRQSNARVKTNLRSQNSAWNGTYDCDDTSASVKPGQVEVCDGIDNNCNGDIDEGVTADLFLDADDDGWGDPRYPIKACHIEAGYAARGQDCDDKNVQIYPGAADVSGDGIDANCDGNDG